MNEHIKLLAEQAGIEFTYDPTETPMRAFVECWEDEMEKFAELIVRECANIDFRREVGLTADDDYEIGKIIKVHFGVEL